MKHLFLTEHSNCFKYNMLINLHISFLAILVIILVIYLDHGQVHGNLKYIAKADMIAVGREAEDRKLSKQIQNGVRTS